MSRDRGIRLQNALAAYLRQWWPSAESAGSGRPGSDILGTPGVVWECKTAREFSPGAFVRQAQKHLSDGWPEGAPPQIPVVVYYPPGAGERSTEDVLAIMPMNVLMGVLREAGYAPNPEDANYPDVSGAGVPLWTCGSWRFAVRAWSRSGRSRSGSGWASGSAGTRRPKPRPKPGSPRCLLSPRGAGMRPGTR